MLQANVLELDLHRWTRTKLQGQDPLGVKMPGLFVNHFGGCLPVDSQDNVMSASGDVVLVPLPVHLQPDRGAEA